ncbi:MAG: hypothetical protein ACRD03_17515 [Acidimicrobiales bacterium]
MTVAARHQTSQVAGDAAVEDERRVAAIPVGGAADDAAVRRGLAEMRQDAALPAGRGWGQGWIGLVLWVGLVVAAVLAGGAVRADPDAHIGAAPFVGTLSAVVGWRLLPALLLAVAALVAVPHLAVRLKWRALLAVSGAGTLSWSVALAWSDGARSITAPLATRYEYLAAVPAVRSPGAFLRGFVEALPTYPTHVKSHPPGMVLVLWTLDRLGLGGAGPATVVVLIGGALAGVAALVALRELAGEAAARRAAPFVAMTPAAVFVATSSDALFAGVSAWGIALVVLATGRTGRRSIALALGGGLLLGTTLFMSYGLALLLAVPAATCAYRRRADVATVAAVAIAAVTLAFAAGGFWWLDGLTAARAAYARGASTIRPYGYFLLANLAAFAVIVGPAAASALGRLRDRRVWLLAGATLVAIVLADTSGLSKGEVERIWLPFAPWVVVACCAVTTRSRPWLAANLGTAVTLQVLLRSPW